MADEPRIENPADPEAVIEDLKAIDAGLESEEPMEKVIQPEIETPQVEKGAVPLSSPSEPIKTPVGAPQEQETPISEPVITPEVTKIQSKEDFDKELETLEAPKGSHPGTKKALSVVKDKAKALHAQLVEAQAQIEEERKTRKELEARPIPKDVEEELKNLKHFQSTFTSEREVASKYEAKIAAKKAESLEFLKSLELSEPIQKFIAENGGVSAVSYSSKQIRDPQNPTANITVEEWFRREIVGNLDKKQKHTLDKAISAEFDLEDEKDKEIAEARKKPEVFSEARKKAFTEQRETWFKEANKSRDELLTQMGDMAKKVEVKPDMSDEDKALCEKHNKQIDYITETFPKLLEDNTPQGRAAVALSALQARYLTEYISDRVPKLEKALKDMTEKYEATKEFNDKVKSSGRTAKQSNATVDKKKSDEPLYKISDFSAMKALDELT